MNTRTLLSGIAALFLATGAAHAASIKANHWAALCTSNMEKEVLMCGFYAIGLVDGLTLWKANSTDPINFCLPEDGKGEVLVSVKQIVEVGLAYIQKQKTPESNFRAIAVVLREAIEEKWPCIGM